MAKNLEKPTANDFDTVRRLSDQAKAQALYLYLYDKSYTRMEDVGLRVFGESSSFIVSCIMRCYGFSDRNGNHFLRKKYLLTYEDFLAFVRSYPNGCKDWPDHITIDKYMSQAHAKNSGMGAQAATPTRAANTRKRSGNSAPKRSAQSASEDDDLDQLLKITAITFFSSLIIIIFRVFTGSFLRQPKLDLLLVIVLIASIMVLKAIRNHKIK